MAELWKWHDVTVHGVNAPRLERVSLAVQEGITAILGWSGAGKSTLLNILVGFEKSDAGDISASPAVNGDRLPVFWVPQEEGLWPHMTAREHLLAVAPPATDVEPYLAMLDLTALGDRLPGRLSVGERSRLSVARALAANAGVLVLDEPLSHVDRSRADACWDALIAHARKSGTSLVYATHSPRTVLGYADRVVFLNRGRVCYDGNVDDLYRRPPTRELAESLGPANWFEPEDAQLWLDSPATTTVCCRPAHTSLLPADSGPIAVARARFCGDTVVAELTHDSGATRSVMLALRAYAPRAGDRVRLVVEEAPCF